MNTIDEDATRKEFESFWENLESIEGHQRSPSKRNSWKAYKACKFITMFQEKEVDEKVLTILSQLDDEMDENGAIIHSSQLEIIRKALGVSK